MLIKRQVLRAEVEDMVFDRLTAGRWTPGARVSIDGLARDLGVSPTPVREALVSLEQSGLIEYRALRGYVVAEPLSPQQIHELMDVRQLLEREALSLAFSHRETLLPDLQEAHAAHGEAARSVLEAPDPDYELVHFYFRADMSFHDVIFEHAGNHYLSSMREMLASHAHRMRQTWTEGPAQLDAADALAEHDTVLRLVQERNHDGALSAMRQHLDGVRERSGGR